MDSVFSYIFNRFLRLSNCSWLRLYIFNKHRPTWTNTRFLIILCRLCRPIKKLHRNSRSLYLSSLRKNNNVPNRTYSRWNLVFWYRRTIQASCSYRRTIQSSCGNVIPKFIFFFTTALGLFNRIHRHRNWRYNKTWRLAINK